LGNDNLTGGSGADTINGGPGNDTIRGQLGNDLLLGENDNDLLIGGDGDDVILAGAGDDVMTWNPGDDNDTLEGQDGFDTLLFNGANIAENIDISANGDRLLFVRNIANVVMDCNDVEGVQFVALGGADTVVVHDLSGTDVTNIDLNLSAGGGGGDLQLDTIIVSGTNGDDSINVTASAAGVNVVGLTASIGITGQEAADQLVIEGGAGQDLMLLNGSDASENIDISANGQRIRIFHDLANIVTVRPHREVRSRFRGRRCHHRQRPPHRRYGCWGRSVRRRNARTGDVQPEAITVAATNGDDVVGVHNSVDTINVMGPPYTVEIFGADPDQDHPGESARWR
jgi:Ca2+-binding RTX toxin-like protein